MTEGLTSNLLNELEKTNHVFSRWANEQVDWIESTEQNFERSMEECECTAEALQETINQLENLRAEHDATKSERARDIELYEGQIKRINELKRNLEMKKDELDTEERREQAKIRQVLEQNSKLREQREQALQELMGGVRMYSLLGLEFQKADRNIMKFIFTQIDRHNPLREFSFQMFVDTSDQYRLVNTSPALDGESCEQLVNQLNADSDIGHFVCSMRKLFMEMTTVVPNGRV